MINAFPWVFALALVMGALAGVSSLRGSPRWSILRSVAPLVTWLLVLLFLGIGAASIGSGDAASWSLSYFTLPSPGASVEAGVIATRAGVAAGGIMALILGYVFLFEPIVSSPKGRIGFAQGAATLALCGVTLSWWATSLWVILLGQLVSGLSGWIVLVHSGRSGQDGADMATSFSRERALGILMSALGLAAILAGGGTTSWTETNGFSAAEQPVGLAMLFFGALLQAGAFPTMGWVVQAPARFKGPLTSALLVSCASAWSGLAMIYRLTPDLVSSGLVPWLVAPALLLAALTAWSAISSALSGGGLVALSGAATMLSAAVMLLAGRQAGGTAAFVFGSLAWATALVLRGPADTGAKEAELPEKLVKAFIALSWSGGLCFAGAAVLVSCLTSIDRALDGACFVLGWVMVSVAALCTLSPAARNQLRGEETWSTGWRLTAPTVILLFSSAIFWTGEWLGVFTASRDLGVGPSLGAELFGSSGQAQGQTGQLISWAWMVALALLLLFQVPEKVLRSGALSWKFAATGFGVTRLVDWAVGALRSAPAFGDRLIRARAVLGVLARASAIGAALIAGFSRFDQWTRARMDAATRAAVEIPAKGLQLLVSGSVQGYLLFTIGFTLALLLHFWNHINR